MSALNRQPWPESPQAFAAAAKTQQERQDANRMGFLRQPYERPLPSIAQGQFGTWDIEVPEDDRDLAVLASLHAMALQRHESIYDTIEQIAMDDDPTLNNDGRLKIVGGIIEPKLEELAELAQREFARADASLEATRAEIHKAIRQADAVDIALHDSIRRHWLESKDPEIAKLKRVIDIDNRLREQGQGTHGSHLASIDTVTLQALAAGPAYLSGLTEGTYAAVRQELTTRLAPQLAKRANALIAGKAKAAQALSALDKAAKRLIDFPKARKLRERQSKHR